MQVQLYLFDIAGIAIIGRAPMKRLQIPNTATPAYIINRFAFEFKQFITLAGKENDEVMLKVLYINEIDKGEGWWSYNKDNATCYIPKSYNGLIQALTYSDKKIMFLGEPLKLE